MRTLDTLRSLSAGACLAMASSLASTPVAAADGLDPGPPAAVAPASAGSAAPTRYGFGLLDRRSIYGTSWFPEPFLAPEMDLDRELRIDWLHGEKRNLRTDDVRAEFEYAIGLLTIEVEAPYEKEVSTSLDPATGRSVRERSSGLGNIELAARHPIFQAVSADRVWDYTIVGALEVALPTRSQISRDTEIVPQIYQLLRIGEHFSVQGSVGLSYLIGPVEGGKQTLEYSAVFGYNVERREFPLPGVLRTIPIFELTGTRGLNRGDNGRDALLGTLGVRFNLRSVGPAQPRLGIGYVFPVDKGGRDQLDWGIVSSLVFEY